MIAWRGASRYPDEKFKPAFEMEIAAMKSVKYDFGLDNLQLMVPFCRTPEEGEMVKDLLEVMTSGLNQEPIYLSWLSCLQTLLKLTGLCK